MLSEISADHVYLACGSTDMRKSIDGLAVIVKEAFHLDPFSNCIFVFCNKKMDKIKILRWDYNGFWLYYRRLERSHFKWPSTNESKAINISDRELRWLLDGLSLEQKQAHKEVKQRIII